MKGLFKKLSCIVLIAALAVTTFHLMPASAAEISNSKVLAASTVPGATSSLKAENTKDGVKLTWKKVSNATGYLVYRKTGNGSYKKIKTISGASTVTYTDTGANTNGTKYTFKLVPTSSAGDGKAKTVKIYFVSRPTISSAGSTATKKLTVKWKKSDKATGYQIRYSLASDFSSGVEIVTVSKASTVSVTIGNLKAGKTYYTQVRAYKTINETRYCSSWSAKKSAKVKSSSSSPSSPSTPSTVYITKTGEKYHRDGCGSLSRSKIAISRAEAIARGYTPCKVCKPG
jgi:Fibronectin type III domain.